MVALSFRDDVAIVELVFYCPALVIAVLLAIRHGFGRSAGWLYLVLFTLARVLAGAFQLARLNAAPSALISLYTGESILLGIGPSQIELILLGLLSRVLTSINLNKPTVVTLRHSRFVQLLTIIGLILGIVGGVNAGTQLAQTGVYTVQTLTKASVALFLVVFALLVLGTVITFFSISHAAAGEKRILIAVALTLPFTLVRLIFSAIGAFAYSPAFNTLSGNSIIYLCMSFLMEVMVVLIIEAVGVTLRKVQPLSVADGPSQFAMEGQKQPPPRSNEYTRRSRGGRRGRFGRHRRNDGY